MLSKGLLGCNSCATLLLKNTAVSVSGCKVSTLGSFNHLGLVGLADQNQLFESITVAFAFRTSMAFLDYGQCT